MYRGGGEKLVDIGVLGATQRRKRAAIEKILGVEGAAMRRIKDQRQCPAFRLPMPQHARNFEAAFDAPHPPLPPCAAWSRPAEMPGRPGLFHRTGGIREGRLKRQNSAGLPGTEQR